MTIGDSVRPGAFSASKFGMSLINDESRGKFKKSRMAWRQYGPETWVTGAHRHR